VAFENESLGLLEPFTVSYPRQFQSSKPAKGFLSLAESAAQTPTESGNPLSHFSRSVALTPVTHSHVVFGSASASPEEKQPLLKAQQTFQEPVAAPRLAKGPALPAPPAALVSSLRSGFVPASSTFGSVPSLKRQSQGDNPLALNVFSSLRFVQEASSLALQRLTSFTRLYGGVLTTCAVALIGLLSGVYAHSFVSPASEELATVSLSQQVFMPNEDTALNNQPKLALATGGASTSESGFPSLAAILMGDESASSEGGSTAQQDDQQDTVNIVRPEAGALVKVRIVGKTQPAQALVSSRGNEACPMPKSLAFSNGLNQANTSSRPSLALRLRNALGFMRPLQGGLLTSRFGFRHGRMHQGVDLAARVGTPILASADGVVTYSGWQAGYGRLIVMQHANGFRTKYAHCHHLFVRSGQRIQQGQPIAAVGNTGHSTGAHLHYEVLVNGVAVNPLNHVAIGVQVAGGRTSSLPTG
jgi:murein DD-endopeptidase MepM/ murein hydrolase activator NlpD